jgi:uncharacterized membrane protein YgcG
MNRKTKKIFLTLALASLLLVSSCQNDYYEENGQQGTVKITEKRFDELIVNIKFRALFEAIPKKKHSFSTALQARTAMEDQYDFTIVDVPIKVATADNLTSYTMLITREDQSNSYFENLVIQEDVDNNKQAVILKYKPIEVSEEIAHDSFDFTGTIEMQKIALNTNSFGYTGTDVCTVTWIMCDKYGTEHVAGPRCTQTYTKTMKVFCDTGTPTGGNNSGGSGGDGGAGSSSGGSGGDGGGPGSVIPDEEVVTSPITPGLVSPNGQVIAKKPCQELNKLTNLAANKAALNNLKAKTGLDKENGYNQTKNPLTGILNSPVQCQANPANPNEILMPTGLAFIGAFHTHPIDSDGWVPMFSDGDLLYLFMVAQRHNNNGQPKDYSEYFLTLTVPEGTFAIKIKDWVKFSKAMNNTKYWNSKKELTALRRKYDNRVPTDNIIGFKKDLLDTFKDLDMGAGLYEANTDFSGWTEVTLNPNATLFNDDPINIPCN